MDASVPAFDLVRPWRTATLVASAVAAVELVAVLVLGVALLGDADEGRAARPSPPPAKARVHRAAPPARPSLARAKTTVLVLNGNGITGAAASTADRVRRVGYRIGAVGNAPRSDYPRSLVMYRPGRRGEGLRLARDLRIRLVAPLDGLRVRDLRRAHVVLVVGD